MAQQSQRTPGLIPSIYMAAHHGPAPGSSDTFAQILRVSTSRAAYEKRELQKSRVTSLGPTCAI